MTTTQTPDVWARIATLANIASSVALPLIVLFVGNTIIAAEKQAELKYKYVELAIRLLQSKPEDSEVALRRWAIEVLDHTSPVPITREVKAGLELRALPPYPVGDSSSIDGNYHGQVVTGTVGVCKGSAIPCLQTNPAASAAKN